MFSAFNLLWFVLLAVSSTANFLNIRNEKLYLGKDAAFYTQRGFVRGWEKFYPVTRNEAAEIPNENRWSSLGETSEQELSKLEEHSVDLDEQQQQQDLWQNGQHRTENEIPSFTKKLRLASNIHWKNCGDFYKDPVQLNSLTIPEEINLEGSFNMSLSLNIQTALSSPIKVSMSASRYLIILWVHVPCIEGVFGSCTFNNVCDIYPVGNGTCPPFFVDNHLPCVCPVQPKSYNLEDYPVDLSSVKIPEALVEGWYRIKVQIEGAASERLGCYQVMFELK